MAERPDLATKIGAQIIAYFCLQELLELKEAKEHLNTVAEIIREAIATPAERPAERDING